MKIDTGAQTNVVSSDVLKHMLPKTVINNFNVSLTAYGGTKIPVEGSC